MPSQLGVWGLRQKKNQFYAKNYAILSKFWYFFPILSHKNFQRIRESGGGLSLPVLEVGDLSPCSPPPAPTPMVATSRK